MSAKNKKKKKRNNNSLLWKKSNYIWMAIGGLCVLVGLLLMLGGGMDSPNEWNADKIYSFRRVTLGPIVILIGLLIEIYAIFKKG